MEHDPFVDSSVLEEVCRPLLRLVQLVTGMETSFVTAIDWDRLEQEVLFSLNTGRMQLPERSRVDWSDSMCRSLFLCGRSRSGAVGTEVPATAGAVALGMQSFFAVPILIDDSPIGTVCGASQNRIELGDIQMESLQLIADALQQLLRAHVAKTKAVLVAELARIDARDARSEARRHEDRSDRMEQLAHTDHLTGLPNRRAFTSRWEDALARSARRGHPIGLMLIDADHFKDVNDSMGHVMGDSVLRAIGTTLLAVSKSADVVARLGGDEFALGITHVDGAGLLAVAEDIRQRFGLAAAALGVKTTLSIGIASSEDCARHELLADADKGLYLTKHAGGDSARLFACVPAKVDER